MLNKKKKQTKNRIKFANEKVDNQVKINSKLNQKQWQKLKLQKFV